MCTANTRYWYRYCTDTDTSICIGMVSLSVWIWYWYGFHYWHKYESLSRIGINTSLAAPGALTHRLQRRTACNAAPPATLHCLQNPKWPPGGHKMADGVWKGVYP